MTYEKCKAPFKPDIPVRDERGKITCRIRPRSLHEMTSALDWTIEHNPKQPTTIGSARREHHRYPWTGTHTPEEYVDMLRNGWPEGLDGSEGLEGLSTDSAERLQFYRNVGGVFPIVPAALAGAPDAMLACRPQPVDNVRGLTLVIDSCFNGGVISETVLAYAQSVMRLVAWLQAEQIDTSIYIVCPILLAGRRYVYTTPVRETGQVLQPERIAAMVHPSWLRRVWFAMLEREYYQYGMRECEACEAGYGLVQHVKADELRQALPEAYSVILLPKVGDGDPYKAVKESINLKLRQGE